MARERKAYFQYYETFEKVVQKFKTAEERENFRVKIINYGFYGIEPEELNEREELVWDIIKDMIDDQLHRREVNRENGKKRIIAEKKDEGENTQTENNSENKKRFEKPTVEEVNEYCTERENGINANQFVDYYEARGWKIGNNSMKDWKAAVRTWEQRQNESPQYRPKTEWPEDKLML